MRSAKRSQDKYSLTCLWSLGMTPELILAKIFWNEGNIIVNLNIKHIDTRPYTTNLVSEIMLFDCKLVI